MLKILGIGLITVIVSIWGESLVARQKKRIKALEALLRLAEDLEAKIRSFHVPVRSILAEHKYGILAESGFLELAVQSTSLSEAVRQKADELCLDMRDVSLISEFGGGLGQYSIDEEAKRCAYYIGEIKKLLDDARLKLPGEAKLFRSAGIMCGILAAVFLI